MKKLFSGVWLIQCSSDILKLPYNPIEHTSDESLVCLNVSNKGYSSSNIHPWLSRNDLFIFIFSDAAMLNGVVGIFI
ncbi:hypothetical protein NL317_31745, partial [Klebsiella pneumoniae]|nr:hypothetical protein [Klebsiella pneumoniae]